MRLTSTDGSVFSTTIERYQYPDSPNNLYDANWLIVGIEVKSPRGAWAATGPYLLQWEAEQLATWLEGITKGAPFHASLGFIERNLSFELRSRSDESKTILRITFEAEFSPPWSGPIGSKPGRGVGYGSFMDFQLSRDDFVSAARSLRVDLVPFPMRKPVAH